MSYLLSLKHLFSPSFLFFAIPLAYLLRLLVEHSRHPLFLSSVFLSISRTSISHLFQMNLKVLIFSFFTYSSPLSSPFPCSFNPLARPSHTCPLQLGNKSSVLSMQSQCYCPLISTTLRINSSDIAHRLYTKGFQGVLNLKKKVKTVR